MNLRSFLHITYPLYVHVWRVIVTLRHQQGGALHHRQVTHHHTALQLLGCITKGFDDDFWANARGIAQGDRDGLVEISHAHAPSCGVVNLNELMRDAQLRRHMRRSSRRAIALGGVVTASQKGHASFAG